MDFYGYCGFQNNFPETQNASPEELRRIIDALYRVHRLSSAITDLDLLLEGIMEESRQVAQAEAASLMLYDPDTQELFFQVAQGDSGDQESLKREIRLKLDQGVAGLTAAQRTAIIVNDAQNDPRIFRAADTASSFETKNLLAAPMVDKDQLVGVIEVLNKAQRQAFTDLDLKTMEMFASLAAAAIVNARLISQRIQTERLAAIGQAVTGLSHYTKNIVTGLNSSADLIELGLEAENYAVLQKGWPIFKRSTKRISNFVQDMLSFSKERQPMREYCLLDSVLQEALDTFRELFVQRDLAVELTVRGDVTPIWIEEQGLFRTLLNLLSNAADAAPEINAQITITLDYRCPETLLIQIADNGPGVAEALREKIFDPFFSTKGSKGTGLGLAVSKKIIHEHCGSLEVKENPPGGALFEIRLPRARPEKTLIVENVSHEDFFIADT